MDRTYIYIYIKLSVYLWGLIVRPPPSPTFIIDLFLFCYERDFICGPSICLHLGAASELRMRFRANKTGLRPPLLTTIPVVFLLSFPRRSSVAVLFCLCGFARFIAGVCVVLICFSSHLLLVPREGCAS